MRPACRWPGLHNVPDEIPAVYRRIVSPKVLLHEAIVPPVQPHRGNRFIPGHCMARPRCGASCKRHLRPDGRAAAVQYPQISEKTRSITAMQPNPLASPIPDRHVVRASHRRIADVQLLPLLGLCFVTPQVGQPLGTIPAAMHQQRRRARIPNHHVAFTFARPSVTGFESPSPGLVPPDVPVPLRRRTVVAVAAMHPERPGGLIPAGRVRRAGRRAVMALTRPPRPGLDLHIVGPQVTHQATPVLHEQSPTQGVPGAGVLRAGRGHQSAARVGEIPQPLPGAQGAIEATSKQRQQRRSMAPRRDEHESKQPIQESWLALLLCS